MRRYLYVPSKELPGVITRINKAQTAAGTFYNVSVQPYKGKKHPADTVVVTVG